MAAASPRLERYAAVAALPACALGSAATADIIYTESNISIYNDTTSFTMAGATFAFDAYNFSYSGVFGIHYLDGVVLGGVEVAIDGEDERRKKKMPACIWCWVKVGASGCTRQSPLGSTKPCGSRKSKPWVSMSRLLLLVPVCLPLTVSGSGKYRTGRRSQCVSAEAARVSSI